MTKRYHIISNEERDPGLKVAEEISEYICNKGAICTYEGINRKSDVDLDKFADKAVAPECIIVLGGDGTIIQVASKAAQHDLPILGINLGTLGYLAEVERDNINPAIDKILSGEYEIEERMMLEAGGITSLNDIVISRNGRLRVIEYELKVNGKVLNHCLADGMIVSTPTGSTGYSLSSGGPIVEPDASLILVTPICPHTLNTRSIVLSPDDTVEIGVSGSKNAGPDEACVAYDGIQLATLNAGESVIIKRSAAVTKIVKINKESFLDVLSRKMNN